MKQLLYIVGFFVLCACGKQNKKEESEILIFCASSLTNVVSEIAEEFEAKHNVEVHINFASSGALARQIEHGASPAVFISANKKWIAYLNEIGKTVPEYEKVVAGNSLVLVTPNNSKIDSFCFEPKLKLMDKFSGRLSLGDPKHVPAGSYAMQAIEKLECQNKMESRLLPAKDVRSALLVVELGETEVGIVYKTDALKSEKVRIIAEIPAGYHTPIAYCLAVLKGKNDKQTKLFYDFLNTETATNIWIKYGFKV